MQPSAISPAVREKVHELSADVPVKFTTMEALNSEGVAAPRFRTLLLGIFAGLAVGLALAGVYGVMSYVVGQRSNEIGLRMALGASRGDVLRLVLRQTLLLAGAGIVIGLAGAAAVTQFLTSILFGVKSHRSCDVRRGGRPAGAHRSGSELHSSEARDACGPHGRAPL